MIEKTVSILKALGNPNKAKIIAHLAKHRGETAEGIGKHLGYPLPTVYKYLRELEAARAVESEAKGNTRVYFAGDFKLEVSPEKLVEAFEEQAVEDVYRAKFGDDGMKRLREVARKVKAGKMTYRQAASTLGITYYEFVSLLEETGTSDIDA
jgi:DNA-binding transcriptional ArsR family regulator